MSISPMHPPPFPPNFIWLNSSNKILTYRWGIELEKWINLITLIVLINLILIKLSNQLDLKKKCVQSTRYCSTDILISISIPIPWWRFLPIPIPSLRFLPIRIQIFTKRSILISEKSHRYQKLYQYLEFSNRYQKLYWYLN